MYIAIAYYIAMRKGRMTTIEVDDRIYAERPAIADLKEFADEQCADLVQLYRIGRHQRSILIDEFVRDVETGVKIENGTDVLYSED